MTAASFRAWRKRHRLTQLETARLLGISIRQVSRFEAGEAPIPRTVAMAAGWAEVMRDAGWLAYGGQARAALFD